MKIVNFVIVLMLCIGSISLVITSVMMTPVSVLSKIPAMILASGPALVLLFGAIFEVYYDWRHKDEG